VTITLNIDSDGPVLVLVVPVRPRAPRSTPPAPIRPAIETTGEELPGNVIPFRQAVGA
jgi:hypothetical protein